MMKRLRFVRAKLASQRGRMAETAIFIAYSVFRIMPTRLTFSVITLCEYVKVPGREILERGFQPIVARSDLDVPGFRLSTRFTRAFVQASVRALHGVGAHRECCEFVEERGVGVLSAGTNWLWAGSLFELGRFSEAREAIGALASWQARPQVAQLKAHLDLIAGDEAGAIANLEIAVRGIPQLLCPHQNLAARYKVPYSPTELDILSGSDGRLFDAYNYVGQRVIHVGEGQRGASLFGAALAAQKRLRTNRPNLSGKLNSLLRKLDIEFDDLRILPAEWFTQIGHQGLLERLLRMRELGWWSGKVIFLMPSGKIANDTFQRLFERYGHLLVGGINLDEDVTAELLSLQRWCGMCFNAFELPSAEIVPWQEAGAMMMQHWEGAGLGCPAREEFDRVYGSNQSVQTALARIREHWGIQPDDWYVCLHLRDASHYGELAGAGQTHRNVEVDAYVSTIRHVTEQGGWVIKLGGPRSPKLPKMPRVFDYARSASRSDLVDIHLIRNAKYFIGTTSGLTDVAITLGTPCALVNCVSVDAQIWSDRVRFALKRIRRRDGSYVSQRELTSAPWRWRMFTSEVLARHGATLAENTSDEILETAKEVESLASGQPQQYTEDFVNAAKLLTRWRSSLAISHFYGNAQPSVYYINKHSSMLDTPAISDHRWKIAGGTSDVRSVVSGESA